MNFRLDPEDFRSLVRIVVAEVFAQTEADREKLDGRLGYTEPEAAALLGVARHTLRDCRLRGEISARLVGRRYIYSRESLLRFLNGSKP